MDEQTRSNIISGAFAMPPVALLLGLWEVCWSFSALPAWFWPALLAVAVVGAASNWLQVYGMRQTGTLARTVCVGAGWGLGVMFVLGLVNSLGEPLEPTFFVIWSLASLAFGYWMQGKAVQSHAA